MKPKPKYLQPGDVLPASRRVRGIVGVRKMAVAILQQQLESMKNQRLSEGDRDFVIEAVKSLVGAEKVAHPPGKTEAAQGSQLPALDPKT